MSPLSVSLPSRGSCPPPRNCLMSVDDAHFLAALKPQGWEPDPDSPCQSRLPGASRVVVPVRRCYQRLYCLTETLLNVCPRCLLGCRRGNVRCHNLVPRMYRCRGIMCVIFILFMTQFNTIDWWIISGGNAIEVVIMSSAISPSHNWWCRFGR